jgi:hypothetical protein
MLTELTEVDVLFGAKNDADLCPLPIVVGGRQPATRPDWHDESRLMHLVLIPQQGQRFGWTLQTQAPSH